MDFKNWLNLRYETDAKARNKELENQVIRSLSNSPITIVDIGAGTGSNLRHYADVLPQNHQKWILLDQDFKLLDETITNLSKDSQNLQIEDQQGFNFQLGSKNILMELNRCDVFSDEIDNYLQKAGLIVSNAFFDLPSESQLLNLLEKIDFQRQILLSTINYEGMIFDGAPEDEYWIGQYEKHMQRDRTEGPSIAQNCVQEMSKFFDMRNIGFSTGKSDWELPAGHPLISGIFDFMQNAFEEMELDLKSFREWKKSKADNNLMVKHRDIATLLSVS